MTRQVRVEIGRAWLAGDEAARLAPGSRLRLDESAEAEVYADAVRIARGELAAVDGMFAVKVTELAPGRSGQADCGLRIADCGLPRSGDPGVGIRRLG